MCGLRLCCRRLCCRVGSSFCGLLALSVVMLLLGHRSCLFLRLVFMLFRLALWRACLVLLLLLARSVVVRLRLFALLFFRLPCRLALGVAGLAALLAGLIFHLAMHVTIHAIAMIAPPVAGQCRC